jgi:uncharacterized protein YfcZ (UPF0381/DUF406 family)
MKIESRVAEATKYSSDALEAFYTAVDNGQARLALLILVDVIEVFADKLDELEEFKLSLATKVEEVKPEPQKIAQEVKAVKQEESTELKAKPKPKEEPSA